MSRRGGLLRDVPHAQAAAQVREDNSFCKPLFMLKMIILPRQARDKQRENLTKRLFSRSDSAAACKFWTFTTVCEQPSCPPRFIPKLSFYQGRLRPDIGKTQQRTPAEQVNSEAKCFLKSSYGKLLIDGPNTPAHTSGSVVQ
jgi:hypothetical protein